MKTILSATLEELYENRSSISPSSSIWSKVLEAKDTLEHHAVEVQHLKARLETAELRYTNLYKNYQQTIKDFRAGIIISVLVTAFLMSISYYFI